MKQHTKNEIIESAFERGIEVRWAKHPHDIQAEGIHLMDPNSEQLIEGLVRAITHGANLVMIHSRMTWQTCLRLISTADDGENSVAELV
jgi:hypothetical protein